MFLERVSPAFLTVLFQFRWPHTHSHQPYFCILFLYSLELRYSLALVYIYPCCKIRKYLRGLCFRFWPLIAHWWLSIHLQGDCNIGSSEYSFCNLIYGYDEYIGLNRKCYIYWLLFTNSGREFDSVFHFPVWFSKDFLA